MKRIHLLIVILLLVLGLEGYNLIKNKVENDNKPETPINYVDGIENNKYNLVIAVDLDDNGIDAVPMENYKYLYFDYDGDRFSERTAWINSDDAFLVMDTNNDGIIDKGEELFGSNMSFQNKNNPFASLCEFDENSDSKISKADSAFDKIFIWQDENQNAAFDDDEKLISLAELDVEAVSLDYSEDSSDFEHIGTISLNKNNGSSIQAEAVLLQTDKLFTEAMDILEETPEIAKMPDLKGYGKAHTLHQAMLRDENLKEIVIQFGNEKNRETRKELFNKIIFTWTGVINNPVDGRGQYVDDGRKVDALEVFFNRQLTFFDDNDNITSIPNVNSGPQTMKVYDDTLDNFYNDLLMQTHFVEAGDSIGENEGDLTHTAELLYNKMQEIDEPEFAAYFAESLIEFNHWLPKKERVDLDSFVEYFEVNAPEYVEQIKKVLEQ